MSPSPSILSSTSAERARATLERIRTNLDTLPVGYSDHPGTRLEGAMSMGTGRIGNALYWAYDTAQSDRRARADAALDLGVEELAQVHSLMVSLWAGFCGTAWIVEHVECHLSRQGAEEANPLDAGPGEEDEVDDANDDIDTALATVLGASTDLSYDLPKGLAGFAVYALERFRRTEPRIRDMARANLEKIAEHFAATRVSTDEGTAWKVPQAALPERLQGAHPDGVFHRGLAHGVPGALVAVARMAAAGIRPESCVQMAADAVEWLRNTQGGRPEVPSWCAAACGRAAALVLAGNLLDESRWRRTGLEIARAAAERPASALRDTGICHGTAGVAYTFLRLHQMTEDPILADAARDWFDVLLQQIDAGRSRTTHGAIAPHTGIYEDRFGPHTAPPGHVAQPQERGGLLRGAAGVGLVLMEALNEGSAAAGGGWDRCLLLSD